jgi:nucleotide-binding universal stress UspA family protein
VLIVGYDGHERAANTLLFAADFATRLAAHLHVVHVVDLDDYPIDPDSAFWEERAVESIQEEHDAAASTSKDWTGSWSYDVEHGDPAKALTRVATQKAALLIVVGARAGGVLRHILSAHGSVTNDLSREGFPVLVAPAEVTARVS